MLKLSIEKPHKVSDYGNHGYARYRIDFEDLVDDWYVLGWVLPMPSSRTGYEMEAREFLFNIDGWRDWGIVKEVYQDDLFVVQRFKVRLYRAGLVPDNEEPEVTLLEEREFGAQHPID